MVTYEAEELPDGWFIGIRVHATRHKSYPIEREPYEYKKVIRQDCVDWNGDLLVFKTPDEAIDFMYEQDSFNLI